MTSYKTVLLGESNVGKTSIVLRLTRDQFKIDPNSTIGCAFNVFVKDDIKLEIWDTAGQERFLSLMDNYHRNANLVLMVYDADNIDTINRLHYYFNKLQPRDKDGYKVIIVGSKLDKIDSSQRLNADRLVRKEFAQYDDSTEFEYIFVSSKTGDNIVELGDLMIEMVKKIPVSETKVSVTIQPLDKNKIGLTSMCGC